MALHGGKITSDMKLEESIPDSMSEDDNLWSEILNPIGEQKVQEISNKLPSYKALLVLGDNESGKTSLVAKLQGNEDPKKGSGLEYHCIYVRDEYRDDHTRLGVWVLDGDPWHRNLLKYALNEETFPHTTVILTAAMTKPWDILDSLQNWIVILDEHIQRLRLPEDVLESHKSRVLKRFQEYQEFQESESVSVTSPLRPLSDSFADDVLTKEIKFNLGLEIVVVLTKTDFMSTLERDYDFKEEHFDFIQLTIRNFCLLYGASLVYVSVKEDKNCDRLSKYLLHRIYSFPFKTPASVVEKDAVFIPAGWDSSSKNSILVDNLTSMKPNDPYHEVIVKPINRKPLQREAEIIAEDDQAFLCRLQTLLNQQVPASGGRPVNAQDTPIRTSPGVQKTADRRISGSPGVQASPKKIEGKAGTVGGGEGVLQNFFNSLLNRKTGSPIGGPLSAVRSPGDKSANRHDAVAELDRISGRPKKPGFSSLPDENVGNETSSPQS